MSERLLERSKNSRNEELGWLVKMKNWLCWLVKMKNWFLLVGQNEELVFVVVGRVRQLVVWDVIEMELAILTDWCKNASL